MEAQGFTPFETDFGRDSQQKNWMPFIYQDKIYVIHQLVPRVHVLELDESSGSAALAYETPTDAALKALKRGEVRGGSQCVHVPTESLYLGVAHVSRGRSMYTHFFFAIADEPPFNILGVSREWCVAHEEKFSEGVETLCEGVQFVSGLALLGNHSSADTDSKSKARGADIESEGVLVMTYGVMDCDARVTRMPLRTALSSIRFDTDRRRKASRTSGRSSTEL